MAARWIILTPSLNDDAWRAAIAAAGADAGLTVILAHPDHPSALLEDPSTVVITNMPTIALEAGADVAAVITPQPASAVRRTNELFELKMPQGLWVASQIVAEALSIEGARRFDAKTLAEASRPIELLPGLRVAPPAASSSPVDDEAAAAMALYRAGLPAPGATVRWDRSLFLYDERGSRPGQAGVVDVTGRPRILVYGPYVALTPGLWRQRARFSLDESAASHQFRIDWGTQADWVSHSLFREQAGIYEIELEHEWTAPAPAEFRILMMDGAFAGTLEFMGGEATLVRAHAPAAMTAAA